MSVEVAMVPFAHLLKALEEINDPRRAQGQRYKLSYLLLYCEWDGACAESIDFGFKNAENIVANLIVDDGVKERFLHFINFLVCTNRINSTSKAGASMLCMTFQ